MNHTDSLRPRDIAVLRALADANSEYGLAARGVHHQAFPDAPYRQRSDAGITRTLDRLERLGFVRGCYRYSNGRFWSITSFGRTALEMSTR